MKYTLKNYQELAVDRLVDQLQQAGESYRNSRTRISQTRTAVSLAAVTGAGKTVMAAATIERLVKGTPSVPADPTATFLWVSDSPDLNTQSRHRIESALGPSRIVRTVEVDNGFREERLAPQTLYFINIQKLSRTSLIARGHYTETDDSQQHLPIPDAGDYNMWQTIANTLSDENTTLYLILDEAHRGMKRRKKSDDRDRGTIVQRLINGDDDVPAVPVVLGISATPDRFRTFMSANSKFFVSPEVTVDAEMVQESGLLKDTIVLSVPDEKGNYDHALLAQATQRLKEITAQWNAYTAKECIAEDVAPLMLVQVPDKASDALIDSYVDTIRNEYPELSITSFAHVFGDDKPIKAGGTQIEHESAERIQESKRIRVLFAKEAISTGWDCPRAEVMVSFRAAKDKTHITQLIGRMVRTPLARRVEGDDILNSVVCILPKFDRTVAESVARTVAKGGTDWSDDSDTGAELRRVLIAPETLYPATSPEALKMWEVYKTLPTEIVPMGNRSPIAQLAELAVALSNDGLLPGAVRKTNELMFRAMEAASIQYDEVSEAVADISAIEVQEFSIEYGSAQVSKTKRSSIDADTHAIEVVMREAERVLGSNLAKGYVNWLIDRNEALSEPGFDELLRDSQIKVAAIARSPKALSHIYSYATELSRELIEKYRVQALKLSDSRSSRYRSIFAHSNEPVRTTLEQPINWSVATYVGKENASGEVVEKIAVDRWADHLMQSQKDNLFPAELNEWEKEVFKVEAGRNGFYGWFRNPSSSSSALTISFPKAEKAWGKLRPDFIFFHQVNESMKASIIDPHSAHLGDALAKLIGYARFVENYPDEFFRVESVVKVEDEFRVLDINRADVREAILNADSALPLYTGEFSAKYV